MSSRNWNVAFAAALAAASFAAGCKRQPQAAPPPQAPEVGFIVVTPQPAALTTDLPGRTVATVLAEIRPQVGGIVTKRLFTEGAEVRVGDPLYEIDDAPYKAALATAEAALDVARRNADHARTALAATEANIAQRKATRDLALVTKQRFEDLAKAKVASASEHDEAVTAAAVAEAALQLAQAQAAADRSAIAAADAAVKQAEAAARAAGINVGYTKIAAPVAGRIGRSSITDGALVAAYQPAALATIQTLDPIYVDVPQSTTELLRLRRRLQDGSLGSDAGPPKVRLTLEDGTVYPLEGTLQFRDVTVDPSTGSVTLRAKFPNPGGVLLPGMFVRAVVTEGVAPGAILVPQQAVVRDAKGTPTALVIDSQGKASLRILSLDRAIGNQWLVTSGLAAGDKLIVDGFIRVKPGMPVRPVPANLAAPAAAGRAAPAAATQPATKPS